MFCVCIAQLEDQISTTTNHQALHWSSSILDREEEKWNSKISFLLKSSSNLISVFRVKISGSVTCYEFSRKPPKMDASVMDFESILKWRWRAFQPFRTQKWMLLHCDADLDSCVVMLPWQLKGGCIKNMDKNPIVSMHDAFLVPLTLQRPLQENSLMVMKQLLHTWALFLWWTSKNISSTHLFQLKIISLTQDKLSPLETMVLIVNLF